MSIKGDLLQAIDEAPGRLRTFQASLRTWRHHERSRRAFKEFTAQRPGRSAAYAVQWGRGAAPDEATSERRDRVWVELPNRWRIEAPDQVDVSDGQRRWAGRQSHVNLLDDAVPDLGSTMIGRLVRPGPALLGALAIGTPVPDAIDGRHCFRVDAQAKAGRRSGFPQVLPWGGMDHTLWVDTDTGIILRHVGRFEGQPCVMTEFDDVLVDHPVDTAIFQFVALPGTVVIRRVDQLVKMAEEQGIDLVGVDRNDAQAVEQALRRAQGMPRLRTPAGQPSPAQLGRARRAKHLPLGPPPADEAQARAQVVHAYEHLDEVGADGTTLVNVHGGEGMAELLARARQRVPGVSDTPASFPVEDVVFLRSDEAVVWFSIVIEGTNFGLLNGREGRAVLVDGSWKVERGTVVDLLAMAGVAYPADQ